MDWEDGYPTDEFLKALRLNRVDHYEAAALLRSELATCAEHCCASYDEEDVTNFLGKPVVRCRFSTGGWSGAEDLIGILLSHFWVKHLQTAWRVGGHYEFEIPTHPGGARDG